MKFLADECCDADMIASLRADGHDILYIMEFKNVLPRDEEAEHDANN